MEALISYRKPPVVTEAASFKEKVREREREKTERRGQERRGGEPSGGSRKGLPENKNVTGAKREPSTRTGCPREKKPERGL